MPRASSRPRGPFDGQTVLVTGGATRRGGSASYRGQLGDGEAGTLLARALKDASPYVRAEAARAAGVRRVGFLKLFTPASFPGTRRAWRAGHRVGMPGRRTDQLGATFVIGPGAALHYSHHDAHTADHAPLDEIFAALEA